LYLATCAGCEARYVQDSYALDDRTCPLCATNALRRNTEAAR
jgi:hypothetical protein